MTTTRLFVAMALTAGVSVASATGVMAQDTTGTLAGAPAMVGVGFDGGFFIQSDDGNNRLTFGMIAQTDGRFSTDTPNPIINTLTLRKIRPTFAGRIAKYFDFKVMPDFGSGTTVVQDAYFDIRFSPKLRVRIGKDKTPIGYELLESDAYLWFPERALASQLVPNRDIGVQVQGDLAAGKVYYAGGVLNGIPDGSSSTTELDTNNDKDLAGRIVVQPFRRAANPTIASGFGFQVGGSTGKETGALPTFKTSVQQTFFSYASAAAANGERHRLSPAVFYYVGPFAAFAEYMQSTQAITLSKTTADVANHAWNVQGSWLITGEAASYAMIRPHNEFDPENGHWGALQVLARYSVLTVDQDAFTLALAAATASREARQLTIASNWYPSAFIKFYFTYERTTFSGGAARPTEHAILVRAQLAFGDRR
jgi:phosphate-selective porin OprO/OprP